MSNYPLPLTQSDNKLTEKNLNDFLNMYHDEAVLFEDSFLIDHVSTIKTPSIGSVIFLEKKISPEQWQVLNNNTFTLVITCYQDNAKFRFSHVMCAHPRELFISLVYFIYDYHNKIRRNVKNDVYHHRENKEIKVGDFVHIGVNTVIGDDVVIQSNVSIGSNCRIGNGVTIKAGTTIGHSGFGHFYNEQNQLIEFPHIGGVIIEDDVELGCNNNVSCGSIHPTILKNRVKTGDLVHVAHNAIIGPDSLLAPCCSVSGRAVIGSRCFIGANSSVRDGVYIGDDVIIGMKSAVIKDCMESGTYAGVPAKRIK